MNIEIKPEDIDVYVREAILKSTVGSTLVISIEKELNDMMAGYRNPVKQFVQEILKDYVKEYMSKPEVQEQITKSIAKVVNPETIELIVIHGINELQRAIIDNKERYT